MPLQKKTIFISVLSKRNYGDFFNLTVVVIQKKDNALSLCR